MPELIATRYALMDRIGQGGVAVVYRARDERLGRVVALKILREHLATDPEFQERFQREARIAASLSHPNIVGVHDYGAHGDAAFIAMDFVDGLTLKDHIRQVGPLPAAAAVEIAREVLAALAYAHSRGVVHRDVKPQNVMIGRDGRVSLTDFGIARAAEVAGLTQTGTTVGSAVYMAPEQARGEAVGPAADVYAAGLLLYEMLVGRPPFEGNALVQVLYRQLNEAPARPSSLGVDLPAALEAALLRALAKEPAERFASAEEMSRALADALLDRAVAAPAATLDRSSGAEDSNRPPVLAAAPAGKPGLPLARLVAILTLLALAVAGLSAAWRIGPQEVRGGTVARPPPATSPAPAVTATAAASEPAAAAAVAPTEPARLPSTATAAPASPTPAAASPTPAPPSPTPAPPTATAAPPTATAAPPSPTAATSAPTAPPAPTPAAGGLLGVLVPRSDPTATATAQAPVAPAGGAIPLEDSAFAGGYRNPGPSLYRQRSATWVYGAGTEYSTMTARFALAGAPAAGSLTITGLTSENWRPQIAILVNDREIFRGQSPFPQDPGTPDVIEGVAAWGDRSFPIPAGVLRSGANALTIRNLENTNTINQPPWVMVDRATIRTGG